MIAGESGDSFCNSVIYFIEVGGVDLLWLICTWHVNTVSVRESVMDN